MKVGDVAHRLGVSPQAVRFYEERSLVPAPSRGENGYREYDAEDFERLRLLVGLRQLDVPLDAAATLATACVAGRCDEMAADLREVIRERRARVAQRAAELRHLDGRLAQLDASLAGGASPQDAIE